MGVLPFQPQWDGNGLQGSFFRFPTVVLRPKGKSLCRNTIIRRLTRTASVASVAAIAALWEQTLVCNQVKTVLSHPTAAINLWKKQQLCVIPLYRGSAWHTDSTYTPSCLRIKPVTVRGPSWISIFNSWHHLFHQIQSNFPRFSQDHRDPAHYICSYCCPVHLPQPPRSTTLTPIYPLPGKGETSASFFKESNYIFPCLWSLSR